MTSIKLIVTGASARAEVDGLLTSGMVGIPVAITYDSAWDGLTKALVCRGGSVIRTILDVDGTAIVPHECMIANATLQIGVEGRNSDGTLVIPTVWARCGLICSGANAEADPSTDPMLPVWAQLQTMIGNLDELETTARDNLVAAINEALTQGGGTVDPEAVQQIVEGYLAENPPAVTETDPTVPAWAKAAEKPAYTASEIGAISQEDLQAATDAALSQAKESGQFDGAPGADGKSAYQYAVEGGYTGTEAEFAAKLAEEMPDKLPNPNALTFTGAATGTYDGSAPLSVEIPSGGGRTLALIADVTTSEETNMISINRDLNGNAFTIRDYALRITIPAHTRSERATFYARTATYGGGLTFTNMLVTDGAEIGFFVYPIASYDALDLLDGLYPVKVQSISSRGANVHESAVGFPSEASLVQVYTNSTTVLFPAGVNVQVYGVRK